MLNWLRKRHTEIQGNPITIDIHSHLLPGLDDGVQSFEESEQVIRRFIALGFRKLITTPHVMSDTYRNTSEMILGRLSELRQFLHEKEIHIQMDAAAEYYLDEDLIGKIESNARLLTFGRNYLLFETNFLTEPLLLKEFIFQVTSKGYHPVLAHPERYIYLQNNLAKLEDLIDRGVLFQINISSLTGYYSKGAQTTAQKLIDRGYVHFLGSDCHSLNHVELVAQASVMRYYQKAITLPLQNNTLD